ncbi:MAG: DUF4097 family beta strand repeat-containing protein [Streptosporangiales bacterium]
MGTQASIKYPETLGFDAVTDLKVRLVRGHVDVVGTDGPPRVEVHEIEGDPLVVTEEDGRLEVGYEDLGSVFDFESMSGKEALQGLGEALRDLLHEGRTGRAQEWVGRFSWFGRRRRAVVSIAVPRQCPVRVNVVSASAVVAGLDSQAKVKSVSGDITLDGLSGAVDAHTVSGALEAQGLAATLSFATTSGDLTVVEATSERIEGHTVSGDLTADLDLADNGKVGLGSVSGDVTVRLGESTGATVRAFTTSGNTSSGFDGLHTQRSPGKRSIEGVLGDGRGRVEVKTVSGDVHLLRRQRATGKATA